MIKEVTLNDASLAGGLSVKEAIVAKGNYIGMSLMERLKTSSLLGYYETAVHTKDKDWLKQILQLVEVDDASIELILCKTGIY